MSSCAERLKEIGRKVDVLINNAAIFEDGWNLETFEKTMNVNLMGPIRITEALIPTLANGARIINVSSGYGKLLHSSPSYSNAIRSCQTVNELISTISFDETDEIMSRTIYPCYKISKACLNRMTQLLAADDRLTSSNIKVFSCDPGWVRVRLLTIFFFLSSFVYFVPALIYFILSYSLFILFSVYNCLVSCTGICC